MKTLLAPKTLDERAKALHSRLKNKMIIIGINDQMHASVAYLLLENNEVLVLNNLSTAPPITTDAAREILQNAEKPIYHGATLIENQSNGCKILTTIGAGIQYYKSATSVTYVLHPNGLIKKYHSSFSKPPFSLDQAKAIMAEIGSEIYYSDDNKSCF